MEINLVESQNIGANSFYVGCGANKRSLIITTLRKKKVLTGGGGHEEVGEEFFLDKCPSTYFWK